MLIILGGGAIVKSLGAPDRLSTPPMEEVRIEVKYLKGTGYLTEIFVGG
jgi:hypothetical protein